MTKDKWVFMPHAGHLIVGQDCRFHLNTYVGGYIVSTVGEWWADRKVREIHAKIYDKKWLSDNEYLPGDEFDQAYMEKFGYEEIGYGRTYETMVFKAKRVKDKESLCCPWSAADWSELDMDGYKDAVSAYKGHIKMCNKWSKK